MRFLRDRMIEHGKCRGLNLGLNLKRGGPEISNDFIVWRRPGQPDMGVDIGSAYDDTSRRLGLTWHTYGPPTTTAIRTTRISARSTAIDGVQFVRSGGPAKAGPFVYSAILGATCRIAFLESVPCNICGSIESHVLQPAQYDILPCRRRFHPHVQQLQRRAAESSARGVRAIAGCST